MIYSSDRIFRLWDYNVSHDQLLLRSPKSDEFATNVDVCFWRVEYIAIPAMFAGIQIHEMLESERRGVESMLGRAFDKSSGHCVMSFAKRYLVVAAGFKVLENTLDIFESSLEYFAATDPKRDLGEILATSVPRGTE